MSRHKKTTEQFIKEAKAIHGDKYDYSKVKYISSQTKLCIICPIHGEFWQLPYNQIKNVGQINAQQIDEVYLQ